MEPIPMSDKDTVLYLMERGMISQAAGAYEDSTHDWLRAVQRNDYLEAYSLSRGAVSLVSNDRALPFRGAPYERTLMRAFMAKNFMADAKWDDAAVEARNVIAAQEDLNGFPDDAYSRYLAGFCMELIDDLSGARLQYQVASQLVDSVMIDPSTGRLGLPGEAGLRIDDGETHELICFIGIGGSATRSRRYGPYIDSTMYAALLHEGRVLGRSYTLSELPRLRGATLDRLNNLQAAKEVARIAVKESIAHAVDNNDEALGELIHFLLFAMEIPDDRQWATLPTLLQVARVTCPASLDAFTVEFRSSRGQTFATRTVRAPLARRRNTFVSFCRYPGNAPRDAADRSTAP
jgi:hypothetical protein